MTSQELYQQAYKKHYRDKAYAEALKDYQEVINLFPDSAEARYAKQQIPNIEKAMNQHSIEEEFIRRHAEEEKAKEEAERTEQERQAQEQERRAQEYAERIAKLKQMGSSGYYEYKVIKLMDNVRTGCLDATQLMNTLNQLGLDGWRLVTAYSNELGKNALAIAGFGVNATADEHILIFERFQKI